MTLCSWHLPGGEIRHHDDLRGDNAISAIAYVSNMPRQSRNANETSVSDGALHLGHFAPDNGITFAKVRL